MNRELFIQQIETTKDKWDVIVIGGGATGVGTAVEAASRGYRTLLLEQADFSQGTSSRSTKLIHGGIRYLKQGNISLVLEALQERGHLLKNAPHLVHNQSFIVPVYDWWSGPFYGVGLKVYDLMAGKLGLGPSKMLSRDETLQMIPTVESKDLRGGVIYYDGQFDDSRMNIHLAQTIADLGGIPLNYMKVIRLLKSHQMIDGVVALDMERDKEHLLKSRVVINAAGIFTDQILRMDNPERSQILTFSQGVHLVIENSFLPGESAIMVPHTTDGRVLFAVPWQGKVIVGTTDTAVNRASLEPVPLEEEIEFLISHAARYLSKDPERSDIKSVFAGIRPLVHEGSDEATSKISRDHHLLVSPSGLVTITGGKWTTYRKMGEDTIDQAVLVGGLEQRPSISKNLKIHGWSESKDHSDSYHNYGSDGSAIEDLIKKDPSLGEKIHPAFPYKKAHVIWSVQKEMARTVEDVLARRTRALFLDAKASTECAASVAEILTIQLRKSKKWQHDQVKSYRKLAQNYLVND